MISRRRSARQPGLSRPDGAARRRSPSHRETGSSGIFRSDRHAPPSPRRERLRTNPGTRRRAPPSAPRPAPRPGHGQESARVQPPAHRNSAAPPPCSRPARRPSPYRHRSARTGCRSEKLSAISRFTPPPGQSPHDAHSRMPEGPKAWQLDATLRAMPCSREHRIFQPHDWAEYSLSPAALSGSLAAPQFLLSTVPMP